MVSAGGSADEHAKKLRDEAARWEAGAEGERRVAAALASLPAGWTVVHDRLLRPGRSEANLDHVVVGPTGIYLVDAKNRAGRVTEHEGGLFQHRHRDGRSESVSLASELTKVHGMAAYMAAESDRPVTPVLCLAGSHAGEFGEPRMVRGVWVVPVAALPGWLRARPVVLSPEVVPTVATRVITDFPSTTTDQLLLSAMAGKPPGRTARKRSPRPSPARPRRAARRLRKAFVGGLMVVGFLVLLNNLPAILTAGVESLATAGQPSTAAGSPSPTTAAAAAKPVDLKKSPTKGAAAKKAATPTKSKARPKPLGPPDCADASAAEIKAIIKRSVKPVVTSQGCAWGTRLDDPSTVLVTITMAAEHNSWDTNLSTSVRQKRVVFSSGYDSSYRSATTASVATGQPMIKGVKPVRARADTVVKVASEALGVSDDRARQMAVAIAAAANGG
ncbi:nuclease-related domain-containing protein [Pedococcus aerophilus]|uniref:nuclease-related domain-containing protein n=1 Tax=Pedococcus aerophilus TaxID=436356 RepID=UPI0031D669BC